MTSEDFLDTLKRASDDLEVGLLISSAGAPLTGLFLDTDVQRVLRHARLDVIAAIELTHHFAARMAAPLSTGEDSGWRADRQVGRF